MTTHELVAVREQLIAHEGYRPKPYRCTADKLTIGHGRNLDDVGIDDEEAGYLLDRDIARCVADLRTFRWFDALSPICKRALVDMRFQLGATGFRGFKQMIAALERGDRLTAARAAADSKWAARDTPRRAAAVIAMLRTG